MNIINSHLIILICFCLFFFITHTEDYKFYSLSQQRGAACLDGSPTGLYIHQGKGQNKNNFLISFDSGGFCGAGDLASTLQSCYQRSSSSLGTTKNCKPFKNFDNDGVLSTIQQRNPNFYDWTKVFGIYCDGTQYYGSRPEPIPYKDKLLYFRGANNTIQQLRFLGQAFNMYNGNKIVVTGVSAGGIATYLWSNHVLAHTVSAKVYAIPDSGLFLTNYISPLYNRNILRQRAQTMINLSMTGMKYPLQQCLSQHNNDVLTCLDATYLVKNIKVPMLIIQSPYDAWSVQNLLGVTCLGNKKQPFQINQCNDTVKKAIEDYSISTRKSLQQMIKDKPMTGVWAPSCIQHGFSDCNAFNNQMFKVPGIVGTSLTDTVKKFLDDPQNPPLLMDAVSWPGNRGCNGLNNSSLHLKKQLIQMNE